MRKGIIVFALFILAFGPTAKSATWHAAPEASAAGRGSIGNPWPLHVALAAHAQIKPGDTLYLRGGTYLGPGFRSSLSGASNSYITVRSFPGEWAVISDGRQVKLLTALGAATAYSHTYNVSIGGTESASPGSVLIIDRERVQLNERQANPTNWHIVRGWAGTVPTQHASNTPAILADNFINQNGSHVVFRDFEITSSRSSNRIVGTSNWLGSGLDLAKTGKGNKAVNLIIHNVGHPAIGFWEQGAGGEINGCLLWGNGMYDNDGTWIRGNGIYSQNVGGMATIKNIITFKNFTEGAEVFGETGPVRDFRFLNNIAFANGRPRQLAGISGSTSTSNIWYDGNVIMGSPNLSYVSLSNQATYFINNILVNGSISLDEHANSVITNNLVFTPKDAKALESPFHYHSTYYPKGALNILWDYNTYFLGDRSSSEQFTFRSRDWLTTTNARGGEILKFHDNGVGWTNWSGFDVHTVCALNWPTNYLKIIAQLSDYDSNRWHICVINTGTKTNTTLDLATLGFTAGQRYELRDAQNYFTVLSNGTYTGAGALSLPLALTSVSAIPGVPVNKHTNLDQPGLFNAFVLRRNVYSPPTPPSALRILN